MTDNAPEKPSLPSRLRKLLSSWNVAPLALLCLGVFMLYLAYDAHTESSGIETRVTEAKHRLEAAAVAQNPAEATAAEAQLSEARAAARGNNRSIPIRFFSGLASMVAFCLMMDWSFLWRIRIRS